MKILPAIKAGEELKNVIQWKNVQATGNALAVVLSLLISVIQLIWPDVYFTADQLVAVAGWAATGLAGINGYLTIATTKKIGTKNNG